MESGSYAEYHPISALTESSSPIEFVVGGSNDYIDLSNTILKIKCKITQADGTATDHTQHHVGPINNLLHSLFSEVEVRLNDVMVSSNDSTYSQRAYMETLLTYGGEAKSTHLRMAMFVKDEAAKMDNANGHADGANAGLKARTALMDNSAVVDLMGRLHCDIFFQDRFLLSDVSMRIKLIRNKDAFVLMSSHVNPTFKMRILEATLLVRKAKISPSVQMAHNRALERDTAKYPIKRIQCKTYTIPRGVLSHTQENVISGQLPNRLIIALVDNEAWNGSWTRSPYRYRQHGLRHVKVFLDGQSQLIRPIEVDYATNNYVEGYASIYAATGKLFRDESCNITHAEYPNGYSIYAFDLSPDYSGDCDHYQLSRDSNVRIDLLFGEATPNTINALIYIESDGLIQINRNRQVLFDYSN